MRCFVVGGTGFLGGAMADALVDAGHSVTVLSRRATLHSGQPKVEVIQGDRYGSLGELAQHSFEWVFNSCAYSPDAVQSLLMAVGDQIQRYVMISSISAYGVFLEPGIDETKEVPDATKDDLETAAKIPLESRTSALAYGPSYGPLKRASEIMAESILGDRATLLRVRTSGRSRRLYRPAHVVGAPDRHCAE